MEDQKTFHLHLISDATGETLSSMVRACCAQYPGVHVVEHVYSLVRTSRKIEKVFENIQKFPGMVLYTMMMPDLAEEIRAHCDELDVQSVPVLDPLLATFGDHFGADITHRPGGQHELNEKYFTRIEALNYTAAHDDGQLSNRLEAADVVLVGVSRTSKTPTCMYLANKGFKAANVPFVPNVPLPDKLFELKKPLIVGLTIDPKRLVDIRKQRLLSIGQEPESNYIDLELIQQEIRDARRTMTRYNWPVIDITRKSIEETSAAIISLLQKEDNVDE